MGAETAMDISEVREKKRQTENAILALLGEFIKETGLAVNGVQLNVIDVSNLDSPVRQLGLYEVHLDVRL